MTEDVDAVMAASLLEECEQELLVVRELAPREPPVYAMLGQVRYCTVCGHSYMIDVAID
jgi:hypothetical protein